MGLFKSIKKAFKKVTGAIKKVVKKTVGAVKKVAKKISKSKILKALIIAGAIIVTGGAALTAFGGGGALATSQLGTFMMNTSAKVLGGTLFTGATTTLGQAAQATGNFLTKTIAKPFGAVGGALGSTARVGANLLTPGTSAFAPGTAAGAPVPFSSAALSGQRDMSNLTDAELKIEYNLTDEELDYFKEDMFAQEGSVIAKDGASFAETVIDPSKAVKPSILESSVKPTVGSRVRDFAGRVGANVFSSLAVGYATESAFGDGSTGGYGSNLRTEGASNNEMLQVYAAERGIDVGSIYNNMTYGTAEPSFAAGSSLYNQATVGVPE